MNPVATTIVVNQILRRDPTRTAGIRARFVSQINRRWNAHARDVTASIVERDCFDIQPDLLVIMTPTRYKQFAFTRTSDKVAGFMSWLEAEERRGILELVRRPGIYAGAETAWTDVYIDSAYQRGIRRGRAELRRAGYRVPSLEHEPGGIASVMSQPFHADRVGLLYTRTFEDLKSVTQFTNAEVRRKISDGLTTGIARGIAEGKSPRAIARALSKDVRNRVDKIGKVRARTIARTEVIRAHHVATIQEYKQAAADMDVNVKAEVSTAGFNVCPICVDLENGGPYSLRRVEGMIPAHPNCRCVIIPVTRGQAARAGEVADIRRTSRR